MSDRIETRLLCAAAVTGVVASIAIGLTVGLESSIGILLGAVLGMLNLHWLRSWADVMVRQAAADSPSVGVEIGSPRNQGRRSSRRERWFPLRLILLPAALYAIFISRLVPFWTVLAGYAVVFAGFSVGVIIEVGRGLRMSHLRPDKRVGAGDRTL